MIRELETSIDNDLIKEVQNKKGLMVCNRLKAEHKSLELYRWYRDYCLTQGDGQLYSSIARLFSMQLSSSDLTTFYSTFDRTISELKAREPDDSKLLKVIFNALFVVNLGQDSPFRSYFEKNVYVSTEWPSYDKLYSSLHQY
jgi:hypothetical protein